MRTPTISFYTHTPLYIHTKSLYIPYNYRLIMVTIQGKIKKIGNSYFILIPKDLIQCEVLDPNKEIKFIVENAPKAYSENSIQNLIIRNIFGDSFTPIVNYT